MSEDLAARKQVSQTVTLIQTFICNVRILTQTLNQMIHQWKCGQPYNFCLHTTGEDPCTILLKPLLKKDAIRCEQWKEEVQNLLIFVSIEVFRWIFRLC